jgi:hypothetical protein
MAQALDDSIDVAIIAEANIAKGNKSIECVSALSALVKLCVNMLLFLRAWLRQVGRVLHRQQHEVCTAPALGLISSKRCSRLLRAISLQHRLPDGWLIRGGGRRQPGQAGREGG